MLSPAHVVPDIDDHAEDDGNEENKEERQKDFERKLNNLEGDFMKRDQGYYVPRIGNLPTVRRLGYDARKLTPSELLAKRHLF
jgi:hypothetical protein